ncbi:MAG: CYTH domain-containing protein [Burkholderiales bacterium]|nr:CYTH domain-containing protein [Burkholderiales bacterium]
MNSNLPCWPMGPPCWSGAWAICRCCCTTRHSTSIAQHVFRHPDHPLRRNKVALRVRQIGTVAAPQWVQTLKMGQGGALALSQRGEWGGGVAQRHARCNPAASHSRRELDPDGSLFAAPAAAVCNRFCAHHVDHRCAGGSRVEVALDIGTVEANGSKAPICELELELLAGSADALFDVAKQIAHSVSLIPLQWSKSEQGYQLAQGGTEHTAAVTGHASAQVDVAARCSGHHTARNAGVVHDQPQSPAGV